MPDQLDDLRRALAGTYAVDHEIGRGGMATVYLATDVKHERKVAIKMLHEELSAAVGHDRFLREIKTTAQLSNPHILPLLDSGEAADALYYVMPFVEGESLRERMDREKELSVEDTINIISDVAAALSYAHGRGVIHRDIKPENIMLSAGEAIVMDFGIARALTTAGAERLTGTGLSLGTAAYMSPEQSMGASDLDGRTDIYSLGTVAFEMLAGETPFTGPNPQSLIAKRLMDDVPRISLLRDIPAPVEQAIRKALARTPADRWTNVGDFAAALRGERTTSQAFPALPPRMAKRGKLVAVAVGVATLAVAALAVTPMLRRGGNAGSGRKSIAVVTPAGMTLVPQGTYALFGGTCPNCLPAQRIVVDSFFIDSTEVTVDAYRQHAKVPAKASADGRLPVTYVMWQEAADYCKARDSLARLPTEREWEAAARGSDGRVYPWGSDWDTARVNAEHASGHLVAVRSFAGGASPAGAFDMIGNAWEWTSTPGPASKDGRRQYVLRGGAYDTRRADATAFFRQFLLEAVAETDRDLTYDKTGFRCARPVR
jgi:formylglycine-generating enzyme required for sulfatase activity/tRNA A-37 threonylcarbamoyl transferase component Bud32